jgi:hypothetical protein
LATETLTVEALTTDAFLTDGLGSRDFATDAFLDGLIDLTGDFDFDFAADLVTDALTDYFAIDALRVDLTFRGLGDFARLAFTGLFFAEDF